MAKKTLLFNKPGLFSPSRSNELLSLNSFIENKDLSELKNSNISSTSSFRFLPPGNALVSTQQIPLDWSLFENHIFFQSAEVATNIAFDKIINEFPFDGNRKEIEAYLDGLTGFEKWVLGQFPKNRGYLNFSGSHISVRDFAGERYPTISKNQTGKHILDPEFKSFSIELQLFVPPETNNNQVIFQKLSGSNQGISLYLSQSTSTSTCNLIFGATSASLGLSASAEIEKNKFNHIYVEFNREERNKLRIYKNQILVATSSKKAEFGLVDFKVSPLVIGSGSTQNLIGGEEGGTTTSFVPQETLSGSIDEFRFWHTTRTKKELELFSKKNVFPENNLKLYFKFNEPTGSIGPDTITIDSSGNSLHSIITNYVHTLRQTGSVAVPLTYEKLENNPILFPAYTKNQTLNSNLLSSGSKYDDKNPNLITKLVPKHYFLDAQYNEGFSKEEGDIVDDYGGEGIPGEGKLGSAVVLSSFLYIWAKFFDELKIFIDHFRNILYVDYDKKGTTADTFLPFVAKYWGLDVPSIFLDAETEQFINAENIGRDISTNSLTLQSVQNQIWRRILTNVGEFIRSKGTLHSVKSLIRTLGVDPDNNFRIREFGGPNKKSLSNARETKKEVSTLIDFSGSLAPVSPNLDTQGVSDNLPFIKSPNLSGSRIETGTPKPIGTFVNKTSFPPHGISNNTNDGLFTSGSWAYEGIYKFPNLMTGSHFSKQSLARINVSGTIAPTHPWAPAVNLIAVSGSTTGSVKCFIRASSNLTNAPLLELLLTGVNIFDGNKWNISFGREKIDNSQHSSSYFLRCGRNEFGNIEEIYTTSSFFAEYATNSTSSIFQDQSSTFSQNGMFITIGSQSLTTNTSSLLVDTTNVTNTEARETRFSGQVGHIRFWSKGISLNEWKEHTRNFKSVGVEDPFVNFNFETKLSGAFERIRLNASSDQPVTESNSSGLITLIDFAQNTLNLSGTGFEPSKKIIKPELFTYSHISPKFDESNSSNKVRVRGFLEEKNATEFNTEIAPIYKINQNEEPKDDTRFSIEYSIVHALDEDIINMFAVLDQLNNVLGNPELAFSSDYPNLDKLRQTYFNRLENKINFRDMFKFFKWFDGFTGMTSLIEKLIPRKTKFFGLNFTLESHMLERHKLEYRFQDQYLKNRESKEFGDFNGDAKKY